MFPSRVRKKILALWNFCISQDRHWLIWFDTANQAKPHQFKMWPRKIRQASNDKSKNVKDAAVATSKTIMGRLDGRFVSDSWCSANSVFGRFTLALLLQNLDGKPSLWTNAWRIQAATNWETHQSSTPIWSHYPSPIHYQPHSSTSAISHISHQPLDSKHLHLKRWGMVSPFTVEMLLPAFLNGLAVKAKPPQKEATLQIISALAAKAPRAVGCLVGKCPEKLHSWSSVGKDAWFGWLADI